METKNDIIYVICSCKLKAGLDLKTRSEILFTSQEAYFLTRNRLGRKFIRPFKLAFIFGVYDTFAAFYENCSNYFSVSALKLSANELKEFTDEVSIRECSRIQISETTVQDINVCRNKIS